VTARARNAVLILLALGTVAPFLPALTAPFLEWDDAANLIQNDFWRGFSRENIRWMLTTMHGGPYQPLAWLSFAVDFTLWGANPTAMRAVNYALHSSSSVLFFLIVESLFQKAAPESSPRERLITALFSALFWAVHPLRVESVVWITERRDVLSVFFYLLAVFLYLRTPERPLRPLFVFCLAVLSKASVITLPLTLLILDRWPLRRRAWADKVPYFLIAIAAGLAGLAGQESAGTLKNAGLGERLALGAHSLWWYAAKTAWPSGLSPYHAKPAEFAAWGAGFAVLAVAGLAWSARRRAPAVSAALLHYAAALAPMAGFVRFGHHLVAERYSYLPGLGLAALAGAGLWAARRRAALRLPAAAAAVVVIAACAALTARGASYWSGDESLWRRAVATDPRSSYARVNLSSHLRRAGRDEDALEHERAAVALNPTLAEQFSNLGAHALGKKQYAEAEALLRSALAVAPGLATAHYHLAAALSGQGRDAEALAALEQAARLDFSDAKILNNLGVALSRAGKHARAEAALRRAAELSPSWAAPRHNLGNALRALGRRREAAEAYESAARLDPALAR